MTGYQDITFKDWTKDPQKETNPISRLVMPYASQPLDQESRIVLNRPRQGSGLKARSNTVMAGTSAVRV